MEGVILLIIAELRQQRDVLAARAGNAEARVKELEAKLVVKQVVSTAEDTAAALEEQVK